MLITHTVAGLSVNSGGPARSVTQLTDSLAKRVNVSVVLLSQKKIGASAFGEENVTAVERLFAENSNPWSSWLGLSMRRLLDEFLVSRRPALLHDNGIWLPVNHYVARGAKKHGIPLVIHPRGMLEPWALDYGRWKKRLALNLYQRRDLESATLLFASAEQEAESIRQFGLRQPIAVIPNGIDAVRSDTFNTKLNISHTKKRNLLFLSRIHPIKGLLNLLGAWAHVQPTGWHLQIAGPNEKGHLAQVLRRIRELGVESSVEYVGIVEGEEKSALYQNADLFVLPSFSENFGIVVAEALAYGVPVIATRGTPWGELPRRDCGWWVEPTVNELAKTLKEATMLNPCALKEMGQRGQEYARCFDWEYIAEQTEEVYRWVLGQGSSPDCVLDG